MLTIADQPVGADTNHLDLPRNLFTPQKTNANSELNTPFVWQSFNTSSQHRPFLPISTSSKLLRTRAYTTETRRERHSKLRWKFEIENGLWPLPPNEDSGQAPQVWGSEDPEVTWEFVREQKGIPSHFSTRLPPRPSSTYFPDLASDELEKRYILQDQDPRWSVPPSKNLLDEEKRNLRIRRLEEALLLESLEKLSLKNTTSAQIPPSELERMGYTHYRNAVREVTTQTGVRSLRTAAEKACRVLRSLRPDLKADQLLEQVKSDVTRFIDEQPGEDQDRSDIKHRLQRVAPLPDPDSIFLALEAKIRSLEARADFLKARPPKRGATKLADWMQEDGTPGSLGLHRHIKMGLYYIRKHDMLETTNREEFKHVNLKWLIDIQELEYVRHKLDLYLERIKVQFGEPASDRLQILDQQLPWIIKHLNMLYDTRESMSKSIRFFRLTRTDGRKPREFERQLITFNKTDDPWWPALTNLGRTPEVEKREKEVFEIGPDWRSAFEAEHQTESVPDRLPPADWHASSKSVLAAPVASKPISKKPAVAKFITIKPTATAESAAPKPSEEYLLETRRTRATLAALEYEIQLESLLPEKEGSEEAKDARIAARSQQLRDITNSISLAKQPSEVEQLAARIDSMLKELQVETDEASTTPSFTESLLALSGQLPAKLGSDSTVVVDESLTIDFEKSIPELQSQIVQLSEKLKSAYPKIDRLPYDVWTSSKRSTLQVWLKILLGKWQTRFEARENAPASADINAEARALLEHMVIDHELSKDAASRMIRRWAWVFENREGRRLGVKKAKPPAELDQEEWDTTMGWLNDESSAGLNEDVPKEAYAKPFDASNYVPPELIRSSKEFTPRWKQTTISKRYYSSSKKPPSQKRNKREQSIEKSFLDPSIPEEEELLRELEEPSELPKSDLPHLTPSGSARMVSVSEKSSTLRTAIAVGHVIFSNPEPFHLIRNHSLRKGDVLSVSRVAGIMAAKKCPDLIPLCHPIMLTHVSVEVRPYREAEIDITDGVYIEAKVQCEGQTGVEMEALTAVMGAALSVVDMCKAIDKGMRIEKVRVVLKDGGRSGLWKEKGWRTVVDPQDR